MSTLRCSARTLLPSRPLFRDGIVERNKVILWVNNGQDGRRHLASLTSREYLHSLREVTCTRATQKRQDDSGQSVERSPTSHDLAPFFRAAEGRGQKSLGNPPHNRQGGSRHAEKDFFIQPSRG